MAFKFNPFTIKLDYVDTDSAAGPVLFLTGNTGGPIAPAAGNINIVGVGGVTVSGAGSTLTISESGEGITWQLIGASQALVSNNGYVVTGGVCALSLPAASAVGDIIEITLDGGTSWTITQGAGQQIRFAANQTTSGAGGSLASNTQGDTVRIVCSVANTRWNVLSAVGNPTVV